MDVYTVQYIARGIDLTQQVSTYTARWITYPCSDTQFHSYNIALEGK